ncbi:hypothetical protein LTR84_007027 [Exophiala bonariae]|uniref:SCP domain-containing protein n=1 Tax=Exophiala bonariae TaxID=1690606 RepID=A0AAV9N2U8_9EURO|nr:hypothetical protein LTR84_007027 [Exophiala bonariae]
MKVSASAFVVLASSSTALGSWIDWVPFGKDVTVTSTATRTVQICPCNGEVRVTQPHAAGDPTGTIKHYYATGLIDPGWTKPRETITKAGPIVVVFTTAGSMTTKTGVKIELIPTKGPVITKTIWTGAQPTDHLAWVDWVDDDDNNGGTLTRSHTKTETVYGPAPTDPQHEPWADWLATTNTKKSTTKATSKTTTKSTTKSATKSTSKASSGVGPTYPWGSSSTTSTTTTSSTSASVGTTSSSSTSSSSSFSIGPVGASTTTSSSSSSLSTTSSGSSSFSIGPIGGSTTTSSSSTVSTTSSSSSSFNVGPIGGSTTTSSSSISTTTSSSSVNVGPIGGSTTASSSSSVNVGPIGGSTTTTSSVAAVQPTTTTSSAAVIVSTTTSAAATTSTTAAAGSIVIDDVRGLNYIDAILLAHNSHRRNHSAVDLTWSPSLAATANTIASSCIYAHNIAVDGGGYGQNIGAGYTPNQVGVMITNDMYNGEFSNFPGPFDTDNIDLTNFNNFGHFTQIVWKGTTQVGCATVTCPGGLVNAGFTPFFTVCNYSPPGNIRGAYSNVGAPLGQPIHVVLANAN